MKLPAPGVNQACKWSNTLTSFYIYIKQVPKFDPFEIKHFTLFSLLCLKHLLTRTYKGA